MSLRAEGEAPLLCLGYVGSVWVGPGGVSAKRGEMEQRKAFLGMDLLVGCITQRNFQKLPETGSSFLVASSTSASFLLAYSLAKLKLSADQNMFYILTQLPFHVPRMVFLIIVLLPQSGTRPALNLHSSPCTLFCGKLDTSASNKYHVLSVVFITSDISFPTSGLGS